MTASSTSGKPDSRNRGGQIVVHVFGRTDVGRTREHNEDAFAVADLTTERATLQPEVRTHVIGDRGTLFMVADGMGGAAAGEIASAMAVETVLAELHRRWVASPSRDGETFARAIKEATDAANAAIHRFATEHPEYRGMGTTATIAGLLGDTLYLAQVGDSRAYLVRDGVARQITKDQSLMQRLIEAGEITEEEAETSERRNIILQALGPEAHIRTDLTHQRIRRGDTLILCSDGLSGQVRAEEIAQIVSGEPELVTVCKQLIDRANEAGGPDNITVVAARFEGDGLGVSGDDDEVRHRVYPIGSGDMTPTMPVERYIRRTSGTNPTPATDPLAVTAETRTPTAPERIARRLAVSVTIVLMAAVVALLALRGVLRSRAQPAPSPSQSTAPATEPGTAPTTP